MFYQDLPTADAQGTYYLDTPDGLVKTKLTYQEWQDVQDVFDTWDADSEACHRVYEMVLKETSKELDPKRFFQTGEGVV